MTEQDAKKEIDQLSKQLRTYQYEYYILNRPSVSDQEYDRLFDRLLYLEKQFPALIKPDSPTYRVGSDLTSNLPEVEHTIPVLSLDKAYNIDQIMEWMDKTIKNSGQSLSFIFEQKIDGASIVLYYEAGILARAVSRGNGLVGNDITANVKTIKTVPLRLTKPLDMAVRGEIFLPKHLFIRINRKMEVPYANPRNLAAGTLRRIKSTEVAQVPLDIFIYEGYFTEPLATHYQTLNELKNLGFRINNNTAFFSEHLPLEKIRQAHPQWIVGRFNQIEQYLEEQKDKRTNLAYDIDGIVTKVDELDARQKLGFTGHHPRWALAFKFDAPEGVSRVLAIDVQIGRTGRATPVARIEPIQIAGTTVSNATLHNQEYIDLLELAIGDTATVSKRGDIIPAIERIIEKNEDGNTTWQMPPHCPTCNSPLKKIGAHHFCTNQSCADQIRGRIHFFVAREQMDIENLGPETIDYLYNNRFIKDIDDIYTLNLDFLVNQPGFGSKKITLIKEGIEKSKHKPFSTVLQALGLPTIGPKVIELLINNGFNDIDSLYAAVDEKDSEIFTKIHGIGQRTAELIIQELTKPSIRQRIQALKKAGLQFSEKPPEKPPVHVQVFNGQTWCVTGSFENFKPRDLAKAEIKKRGGTVTTSVSNKTTHLLSGTSPGSKLQKAQALGVKIIYEDEFMQIIKD